MAGWQDTFRRMVMRTEVAESTQEEMFDHETGESVHYWVRQESQTTCRTNAETGEIEPTPCCKKQPQKRSSFQVPKTVLHNHMKLHKPNQMVKVGDMIDSITASEYYYPVSIEQKFLNETHNISPVVFLLPTLFLFPFPAWLTVVSIIVELCLHMWAHKSNKECKDSHLRYRSPLHTVTSQFCALCKSKRSMEKISQLQDARALKVSVRKPKYSAYVERVSVMM